MNSNLNKLNAWQTALINVITDPEELIRLLELDPALLPAARKAAERFPFKVPRTYIQRIQKGDKNDPLLLQILPLHEELHDTNGYSRDPLLESTFNPVNGLLHKYKGRVLLTLTGTCAINCRYCFRRFFPYEDNNPGTQGWQQALDYIAKDPSIHEVILSGGDPLIANDQLLTTIISKMVEIPHITRLRIHSRIPVVLPERITPELLDALRHPQFKTVMVIHANHANELNSEVKAALQQMSQAGIILLNQSVLLRNVNDTAEALIQLSERLFNFGVLPYYLHVLDKVQGTAHFDLALSKAQELHGELLCKLPGYLVPKLVREQPGHSSKQHLAL